MRPDFRWQSSEAHFKCVRICQLRPCTPAPSLFLVKFPFPNQNPKCLEYQNQPNVRSHVLEFLHEDVLRNDVTAFNCELSFRYNYGFYTQGQTMGLVPCTTNFSLIQMYYFTGILLFIVTLSKTWIELRKFITSLPLFIKSRQ